MPLADWAATADDVAAILRARTTDNNGVELGQFTANTRPTLAAVNLLLASAGADVAVQLGVEDGVAELPERYHLSAQRLAALWAAMEIELSYFPEQINTGRSPYNQLKELYDARLSSLIAILVEGGEIVDGTSSPGMPSYGFPVNLGGMVGWGTEW